MYAVNYNGLRKRDSYDEIVNYIKTEQPLLKYPERTASQLLNNPYFTQFHGESKLGLQDQENRLVLEKFKQQLLLTMAGNAGASRSVVESKVASRAPSIVAQESDFDMEKDIEAEDEEATSRAKQKIAEFAGLQVALLNEVGDRMRRVIHKSETTRLADEEEEQFKRAMQESFEMARQKTRTQFFDIGAASPSAGASSSSPAVSRPVRALSKASSDPTSPSKRKADEQPEGEEERLQREAGEEGQNALWEKTPKERIIDAIFKRFNKKDEKDNEDERRRLMRLTKKELVSKLIYNISDPEMKSIMQWLDKKVKKGEKLKTKK